MVLADLEGNTYRRLQPEFEWKDDGASHVLYVHLPAEFVWEELTLTPTESTRSLNVRGTHMIATYTYIWFNIDIRIPDSATFKEMQLRFQKKTLIVTFPMQTLVLTPQQPLPPPPPPQAKDPVPIPTPHDEPPPPPPQAKYPVPIPTPPNEPPPPPLPLPPPPQAKEPVPIPTPRNEPRKVEERINEGPSEHDSHVKLQPLGEKGASSGATTMIHSTEMKVGREEERKLLVNVLMAAIVLVAIGAYICATLTR